MRNIRSLLAVVVLGLAGVGLQGCVLAAAGAGAAGAMPRMKKAIVFSRR